MEWMETDTVTALKEIRACITGNEKPNMEGCLEWLWADGTVRCRRRQEDQTALGCAAVNARIIAGEAEYEYVVHEAPDGAEGKPLILFLHGFGERGGDPKAILNYGPFAFLAKGGAVHATVIAPHLEENRHWVENSKGELSDVEMGRLDRFLKQMITRYRPDLRRISCIGLSMGGRGTYRLACRLPEVFSAIAVCCGRAGDERGVIEPLYRIANRRVWVFQGMQDRIVLPLRAVDALETLLNAQPLGCFRFTLYLSMGHACYEKACLNGELYDWLVE